MHPCRKDTKGKDWRKVVISEQGSHDILVADFNGDSRPDILGANHGGPRQPVELWLSQVPKPATGPLRVHPTNPRYLTDDGQRPIFLSGSHAYHALQDQGDTYPSPAFDYASFLDLLKTNGRNLFPDVDMGTYNIDSYR